MDLVNMSRMLRRARDGGYAIGAFNILDYNSMKAVVKAAEELHAPVIIQTSVKTVVLWGHKPIITWVKELTADCPVPVAIHLDHCKDVEFIRTCIQEGWSSVMIDASSKPFEENLALTRTVVEMARPHEVSVEAELGEIGGVEDDISVDEEDAHLADPDKAETFCNQLNLDCFAPAIGTAHGVYKGEPKISFNRIEEIAHRVDVPLALHGGTGLSEEVFKKCISLGCAKVNISTQLKHTFIDSFVAYYHEHETEYNPLKEISTQFDKLKQGIKEKIELFGSAGKA